MVKQPDNDAELFGTRESPKQYIHRKDHRWDLLSSCYNVPSSQRTEGGEQQTTLWSANSSVIRYHLLQMKFLTLYFLSARRLQ